LAVSHREACLRVRRSLRARFCLSFRSWASMPAMELICDAASLIKRLMSLSSGSGSFGHPFATLGSSPSTTVTPVRLPSPLGGSTATLTRAACRGFVLHTRKIVRPTHVCFSRWRCHSVPIVQFADDFPRLHAPLCRLSIGIAMTSGAYFNLGHLSPRL
jgi:hypothetical protein